MYLRYEEENFFIDPSGLKQKLKCPSIEDDPSVYLSVIIPAKDEEKRLPKMLDQCIDYLHTRSVKDPKFTSDCSIVEIEAQPWKRWCNADGATQFSDFAIVETAMEELCQSLGTSKALVVGSRAHLKEESVNCTRYTVWLQIVYTRCSCDTVFADAHGRKFQSAGQKLKAPSSDHLQDSLTCEWRKYPITSCTVLYCCLTTRCKMHLKYLIEVFGFIVHH
ncbi:Dolichyl-phosphate beta-glucosyltransferase [Trichinella pseudospiralis]